MSARCRSCGAAIVWAETVNGRKMPLDESPDPDGRFTLDETREPPVATFAAVANPNEEERFTSHFATCPTAAEHRKPR